MPRGGYRVGSGRPKGARTKFRQPPRDTGRRIRMDRQLLPLDYLLALVADETIDPQRRDRAAIAALPFCHAKPAEGFQRLGKKAQAVIDAANAGENSEWIGPWGNDLEPNAVITDLAVV